MEGSLRAALGHHPYIIQGDLNNTFKGTVRLTQVQGGQWAVLECLNVAWQIEIERVKMRIESADVPVARGPEAAQVHS